MNILPDLIDFCTHILSHSERHCGLMSNSGVLRLDLGVEFRYCQTFIESSDNTRTRRSDDDIAIDEANMIDEANRIDEANMIDETNVINDHIPASTWQVSGGSHGFIFRCFLNEVTSTLDINWFSVINDRC